MTHWCSRNRVFLESCPRRLARSRRESSSGSDSSPDCSSSLRVDLNCFQLQSAGAANGSSLALWKQSNQSSLTENSILYKTGNLRRCSHSLMKNLSSVGVSGMVWESGLFSSARKDNFNVNTFFLHWQMSRDDGCDGRKSLCECQSRSAYLWLKVWPCLNWK